MLSNLLRNELENIVSEEDKRDERPQEPPKYVDGREIPPGSQAVAGPGGRVGVFDPNTGRTQYKRKRKRR